MYRVAVRRAFTARHFLIGGDFGAENDLHAHDYVAEVVLEGPELDRFGYLVDISRVEEILNALVARYRDHTLNDFPEFAGLNPSIEHFSRIMHGAFSDALGASNLHRVVMVIWENGDAWASYTDRA